MSEHVDFKDDSVFDPCAVDGDVERPRRRARERAVQEGSRGCDDGAPAAAHDFAQAGRPAASSAAAPARGCLGSLFALLANLLCLVAVVGSLLRFVPWPLDMFPLVPAAIAVGPWYALVAVAALVCALLARRKGGVVFLALLCVAAQAYWHFPATVDPSIAGRATPALGTYEVAEYESLRVMSVNTYFGSADAAEICALVEACDIDVLCLQESAAQLIEDLEAEGLRELLPYFAGRQTGNQIWSAYELIDVDPDAVGYSGSHMPAATIEVGEARVRVVSVHTCAPIPGYEEYWGDSLKLLKQLGTYDTPLDYEFSYLLAGDFNATLDHASLREIITLNGLYDAASHAGKGLAFTWPSESAGCPSVIAIDHMLLEPAIDVLEFETRGVSGTDHKAIIATLSVFAGWTVVEGDPNRLEDGKSEPLDSLGFVVVGAGVEEPVAVEDVEASELDAQEPWVWIEDGRVLFVFDDGELW